MALRIARSFSVMFSPHPTTKYFCIVLCLRPANECETTTALRRYSIRYLYPVTNIRTSPYCCTVVMTVFEAIDADGQFM